MKWVEYIQIYSAILEISEDHTSIHLFMYGDTIKYKIYL